jgi:hypothetical protein
MKELRQGTKIRQKLKKKIRSECPVKVDAHWPVCALQSLIVLSSLALAMVVPSGLHATDLTLPFQMR